MQTDLTDYISDYVSSEYYALLDPGLKPHAAALLFQALDGARQLAPGFPAQADAALFGKVL